MQTKGFLCKILFSLTVLIVLYSCKVDKSKEGLTKLKINYELVRFDQLFNQANGQKSMQELIQDYPYLFPEERPDLYWLDYKKDSIYQMLTSKTNTVFDDFSKEQQAINHVFNHVKIFYPTFQPPKVITLISTVDVNNQVIYADSLMFISLDTYLGKEASIYSDFDAYIRTHLDRKRIPIDVATAVMKKTFNNRVNPVFIERLVDAGKLKYAVQQVLPDYSEADIMNYSDTKYQWAKDNEYSIWQYFMEKEYVYNPDKDLVRRFLEPAPFSKFYIESDMESPGQIGEWIGWQIVKQYAEKNKVSLVDLLAKPPMDIFNRSNYKPNR